MAVALMGAVVGVLMGFLIAWLYFEPKVVSRNRRITQLEREAKRVENPRF